jgi:hypothetical protein
MYFRLNIVSDIELYEKAINFNTELMNDFTDFDSDFALTESKNSKAIGADNICLYLLKKM